MDRRRHFLFNWRLGCLLFIFFLSLALFPVSTLEITNQREGKVIYFRRVSPGDRFEFRYLHSVDKTPVVGYFLISSKKRIKPIETRFQSYGPGLPSLEKNTDREEKEFKVRSEGIEIECFSFFVSQMTQQTFIFKEDKMDFSHFKEGEVIRVGVTLRPLIWEVIFKHGSQSRTGR